MKIWLPSSLLILIFLCSACSVAVPVEPELRSKSEVLMKQGVAYLRLNDPEKARASFEVSYQTYPNSAALDGLGIIELNAGNFMTAEKYFIEAFEIDSNYHQAMANLAILYEKQGFIEEAIKLYRYVLKKNPTNFKARNNFAALLYEHKIGAKQPLQDLIAELERAKALERHPILDNNLRLLKRGDHG